MLMPLYLLKYHVLLLALVSVSEEVRSRCHIKHSLPRFTADTISQENFIPDNLGSQGQPQSAAPVSMPQSAPPTSLPMTGVNPGATSTSMSANRRQKSWDLLDQSAIAQARQHKQATPQQVCCLN